MNHSWKYLSCLSWCNCSIQRSHLLKQLILAPSSFPLSQIFFFSFFSGFWTLSQSCAWDGRNKALLTPNTAESRKPESLISHSRLLSHIPLTFTAWLRFLHLSVVRALVPLGARSPPVKTAILHLDCHFSEDKVTGRGPGVGQRLCGQETPCALRQHETEADVCSFCKFDVMWRNRRTT